MSDPKRVAVIGAGLSGLVAAFRLTELKKERGDGPSVTVYEASDRPGGALFTEKRDGFLFEWGADSFLTEKPAALELCRRLGLEGELISTAPGARRSFIAREGRLVPVPQGFYLTAALNPSTFLASDLFSPAGKLRVLAERWLPGSPRSEDESVASFVRRRFGREALERAGQPLLAGIYTGDPENLSLRSTLPKFAEYEASHGSVTRGLIASKNASGAAGPRYSLFSTLKDGLGALIRKLFIKLPMAAVRLKVPVTGVSFENGVWRLALGSGETAEYDALVVALGAPAAAKLLRASAPALAEELEKIPAESVAVANFTYGRKQIRHALDGAGFVVPRMEKEPLVACSFSSVKFEGRAPEGQVLLRAFVGGAFGRAAYAKPDAELLDAAQASISRYLGAEGAPGSRALVRHERAMVQYAIGHRERCEKIYEQAARLPNLILAGNAYAGVGIPDCVAGAERAAETLFERWHGKGTDNEPS